MNNIEIAVIVTVGLSILLSLALIANETKSSNLLNYFTLPFFLYLIIVCFGNILTTLLASGFIDNYIASNGSDSPNSISLVGYKWFWYSFVGVFGFEIFIKKVNITLFDKGILTINDWITTSKNAAVFAIIKKVASREADYQQRLATLATDVLPKDHIHTFALHRLGEDKYNQIVSSVKDKSHNCELHLAYILANEFPLQLKAEVRSFNKQKGDHD